MVGAEGVTCQPVGNEEASGLGGEGGEEDSGGGGSMMGHFPSRTKPGSRGHNDDNKDGQRHLKKLSGQ